MTTEPWEEAMEHIESVKTWNATDCATIRKHIDLLSNRVNVMQAEKEDQAADLAIARAQVPWEGMIAEREELRRRIEDLQAKVTKAEAFGGQKIHEVVQLRDRIEELEKALRSALPNMPTGALAALHPSEPETGGQGNADPLV